VSGSPTTLKLVFGTNSSTLQREIARAHEIGGPKQAETKVGMDTQGVTRDAIEIRTCISTKVDRLVPRTQHVNLNIASQPESRARRSRSAPVGEVWR